MHGLARLVLVLTLAPLGCTDKASDDSETSSSEADTGMQPEDCEAISDEAACLAAPGGEFGCAWRVGYLATREGEACTLEERGVCIGGDWGNTAAGCGQAPGCGATDEQFFNPYYQPTEGGLLLLDFCGGSPPASFAPCASGEAATADPAECACVCELMP